MNKTHQLQNYLQQNKISAAFITNPDNVFYITGFRSNPHERLFGVMLFADADPFVICPKMEVPDVEASGWQFGAIGHEDTEDAMDILQQAAESRQASLTALAVEKTHLTVSRQEALSGIFPDAAFHSIDDQLNAMRVIKDSREIELLAAAAELADYAIEIGCDTLKEGITELEVLSEIELALKKRGVSHMSFDTMVLFGDKTASPHGKPGNRKLRKGDFVLFDLGVIWEGYCSDITRTVAFGTPSDEQRAIYDTVLRAELASVEAAKAGITAAELDRTARQVIEDAGYGDYFTHRLGHGLGISVHEYPSLHGANDLPLTAGMAFTVEPGIYVPGVAGVRIEDDLVLTEDGVTILTQFPKDLQILGEN
ncbi:M24 family metallopeptidase [Planococcus lenghuensis]|uniref:Peptidase M24 family protein n=1 Tax=Planococcus lenghuensis TaxID=2213202 RepID=A0A1Q2KX59_9BACL|nr:aminopeptidase P family protein [Planococcus lenghuensis]AQQ52805.1 peptidase M24 family protein [Planococcus lenghuensis]